MEAYPCIGISGAAFTIELKIMSVFRDVVGHMSVVELHTVC